MQMTLEDIWYDLGSFDFARSRPDGEESPNLTEAGACQRVKRRRLTTVEKLMFHARAASNDPRRRAAGLHIYLPLNLQSRHIIDSYVCYTPGAMDYNAVATACAFSNESSNSPRRLLACSTNEGTIHLLDAQGTEGMILKGHLPNPSHQIPAAVFEIQWSHDDSRMALATGNTCSFVVDSDTGQRIASLGGHKLSQKVIRWCGSHRDVLATGSRDGSIRMWDIRERSTWELQPTLTIPDAHCDMSGPPSTTTVTGLHFMDSNVIYSSGCRDAILQCWDLRAVRHRIVNGKPCASVLKSPNNPAQMSIRPRGVVSLSDRQDGVVLALCRDSTVYAYEQKTLRPTGHIITHPSLRTNSASASMAISPCRRWIAAGGTQGTVVVANVEKLGYINDTVFRPRIAELPSRHGEINGLSWASSELATASDGGTVRLWRHCPS